MNYLHKVVMRNEDSLESTVASNLIENSGCDEMQLRADIYHYKDVLEFEECFYEYYQLHTDEIERYKKHYLKDGKDIEYEQSDTSKIELSRFAVFAIIEGFLAELKSTQPEVYNLLS